jgi:hypothetical protein
MELENSLKYLFILLAFTGCQLNSATEDSVTKAKQVILVNELLSASSNKQALAYDATQNQIKIADAKTQAIIDKILGSKAVAYENDLAKKWIDIMPQVSDDPLPDWGGYKAATQASQFNNCNNPANKNMSFATQPQDLQITGCDGGLLKGKTLDGDVWTFDPNSNAWFDNTTGKFV